MSALVSLRLAGVSASGWTKARAGGQGLVGQRRTAAAAQPARGRPGRQWSRGGWRRRGRAARSLADSWAARRPSSTGPSAVTSTWSCREAPVGDAPGLEAGRGSVHDASSRSSVDRASSSSSSRARPGPRPPAGHRRHRSRRPPRGSGTRAPASPASTRSERLLAGLLAGSQTRQLVLDALDADHPPGPVEQVGVAFVPSDPGHVQRGRRGAAGPRTTAGCPAPAGLDVGDPRPASCSAATTRTVLVGRHGAPRSEHGGRRRSRRRRRATPTLTGTTVVLSRRRAAATKTPPQATRRHGRLSSGARTVTPAARAAT